MNNKEKDPAGPAPHCIGCNREMSRACRDCEDYAIDSVKPYHELYLQCETVFDGRGTRCNRAATHWGDDTHKICMEKGCGRENDVPLPYVNHKQLEAIDQIIREETERYENDPEEADSFERALKWVASRTATLMLGKLAY